MARKSAKGIKVGSRVAWQTPYTRFEAMVIEDRGNIGVNGRRIWRILTFADYPDPRLDIEVPEEHLTLLSDPASSGSNGSAGDEFRAGNRVWYTLDGVAREGEVVDDYGRRGGSKGDHLLVVQPLGDDWMDEPFLCRARMLQLAH
ncbi:MAG TPA: hypothetical protein VFS20_10955 [Longimicrobium sp.]|nr:hypothetical protein [Longimicrobium sp.]